MKSKSKTVLPDLMALMTVLASPILAIVIFSKEPQYSLLQKKSVDERKTERDSEQSLMILEFY